GPPCPDGVGRSRGRGGNLSLSAQPRALATAHRTIRPHFLRLSRRPTPEGDRVASCHSWSYSGAINEALEHEGDDVTGGAEQGHFREFVDHEHGVDEGNGRDEIDNGPRHALPPQAPHSLDREHIHG